MTKTLSYFNPSYCLSFDEDTVFLDIEVAITRLHEAEKRFSMEIKKCQLDKSQEGFPFYLLTRMGSSDLDLINIELASRLTAELTPNLFSLFYSSDDNETTTHTD